MRRSSVGLALLGCVFAPLLRPEPAGAAAPTWIRVDQARVRRAVLFAFDDHSIPFTDNLQLSMESAEKYRGNPVLSIGPPGAPDEWTVEYYGTVLRIGGKYRMWYVAASRDGYVTPEQGGAEDFHGWRFAYAESGDGIHWTKPDLGLTEFRGSRHNNLIGMPDGFRGYHILVLHEPEERDPARRYKMLALLCETGKYRFPGVAYGRHGMLPSDRVFVPMYSADGLSWRIADELLTSQGTAISPEYHLLKKMEGAGLYRWNGMYYLASQSWGSKPALPPYGRHVQIFRSPDFLHWSETQTMGFAREGEYRRTAFVSGGAPFTAANSNEAAHEQTHEGASVWNRGNVLLGLTGFWHGNVDWTKVTHPLGFIISNDGIHFREPEPDFIFAENGEAGRDWDYGGLTQGQGFINAGSRTYIWYGGPFDQSEGPRTGRPVLREGGVGLLILPRDRFGSLSTRDPDCDGTAITSEIGASGPLRMWVNAEGLGPDSPLRLELLDAEERPLPGYSGAKSAVLETSGLEVPVAWPGGAAGAFRVASPFKIRLRMAGSERNAIRLYAVYLAP